jgi:hypothetical protein
MYGCETVTVRRKLNLMDSENKAQGKYVDVTERKKRKDDGNCVLRNCVVCTVLLIL